MLWIVVAAVRGGSELSGRRSSATGGRSSLTKSEPGKDHPERQGCLATLVEGSATKSRPSQASRRRNRDVVPYVEYSPARRIEEGPDERDDGGDERTAKSPARGPGSLDHLGKLLLSIALADCAATASGLCRAGLGVVVHWPAAPVPTGVTSTSPPLVALR